MLYQLALIKQKKHNEFHAHLSSLCRAQPALSEPYPVTAGKRQIDNDRRYLLAQIQLQKGDWHDVLGIVHLLEDEYANHPGLIKLHEEASQKLALDEQWYDKVKERKRYAFLFRWLGLLVTLLLCGGFVTGGWHYLRVAQSGKAIIAAQQTLLMQAESAMEHADYRAAVELYQELLTLEPRHQAAAKGLDHAIAQSVLQNQYAAGVDALEQGLLSQAQTILTDLERKAPKYRDTEALLQQLATAQATPPAVTPATPPVVAAIPQAIEVATPNPLLAFSGQIVFQSKRNGESALYLMQRDGSQQRLAPPDMAADFDALYRQQQWKEGTTELYSARATTETNANLNLYLRHFAQPAGEPNAAPTIIQLTDFPGVEAEAVWSPLGTMIAFVANQTGNDEIWTLRMPEQIALDQIASDQTDPEQTLLAQSPQQLTSNEWAWDKHPSWSPDGTHLVFYSNRSGQRQIWLMNADGTNQQNISNNRHEDWNPLWIP